MSREDMMDHNSVVGMITTAIAFTCVGGWMVMVALLHGELGVRRAGLVLMIVGLGVFAAFVIESGRSHSVGTVVLLVAAMVLCLVGMREHGLLRSSSEKRVQRHDVPMEDRIFQ